MPFCTFDDPPVIHLVNKIDSPFLPNVISPKIQSKPNITETLPQNNIVETEEQENIAETLPQDCHFHACCHFHAWFTRFGECYLHVSRHYSHLHLSMNVGFPLLLRKV